MTDKTATLATNGSNYRLSRCSTGPSVPKSSISASSTPSRACSPTTPASLRPRAARARSPISTAKRASSSIAATRSISSPRIPPSWRSPTCFSTASFRLQGSSTIRLDHQPPHHGARAAGGLLSRVPPRRAPDGDHVRRGRCAVVLLPRQHRHHRSRAAHDRLAPADRENADDRRDGVQIFHRPAVHLSAEQPQLHGQLPAHDLRSPGRALRGESDRRECDAPDLHPPRRPRAECVDLDGAARGIIGRQPLRVHCRGHRLPVGARSWRRQRGRAQYAARDRNRQRTSRNISPAPRTRTTRSA